MAFPLLFLQGQWGVKISTGWDSWIGFSGGIGYGKGTPLSFGVIFDYDSYGNANEISLKRSNTGGLGFAIGVDIWYSDWSYTSIQFIQAGTFENEELGKMPLYGINWAMFGGQVDFGNSGVFFDFAVNCAFLFPKDKNEERRIGMLLGLSIGLGYTIFY